MSILFFGLNLSKLFLNTSPVCICLTQMFQGKIYEKKKKKSPYGRNQALRGSKVFFSGVQVSLIKNWYPEINNNISKAVACPVSTGEKRKTDILICTFPKFSQISPFVSFFLFILRIDVHFRLILVAKTSFLVCVSNDCATAVLQK